jgi:hypothetical protein
MSDHDASLGERAHPDRRKDSDGLLRAVEALRALEREKRLHETSSAPFHDLERRVEEQARAVFRLAQQENGGAEPDE